MMASSSLSNPDTNSNTSPTMRRKIGHESEAGIPTADTERSRWRTEAEAKNYSIKLVKALGRRDSSSSSGSIHESADRVLAVSAKGRTRWSRAILTNRLHVRLAQINKKHKKSKVSSGNRLKKPVAKNKPPSLQRKVRSLGRLVPGCRGLSFPNLLEETTDYIEALKMQVKSMTLLTELLAGDDTLAGSSDQLGSDVVTSN